MKKTLVALSLVLLTAPALLISSCKKDEAPKKTLADAKKEWVTGTWKQKDIQLAVSVDLKKQYGVELKAGSSMLDDPTINYLLVAAAGANPFQFTRANVYTFTADGAYKVEGANDYAIAFSFPVAGKSGTWDTEVYSSVLALFPSKDKRDPHWINDITATTLNLSITINLPGLGDVPLNLLLEKQ